MELVEIVYGTNMWIEVKGVIEDDSPLVLKAKFLGSVNNINFYIERPIFKGSKFPFNKKEVMNFYFVKEDKLFSYTGSFIEIIEYNEIIAINLQVSSKLHEIQRRNCFRLKFFMPIQLRVISQKNNIKDSNNYLISCMASDVSGGGVRASTQEEFKRGDKVECHLNLYDELVVVQGDVIWIRKHSGNDKKKNEIGIKFDYMERNARENIIRYIFEQQRKLIKKERK